MLNRHLILNNKEISFDFIKETEFFDTKLFNEYEIKVLNFCHSWLTGQNRFTVKTSGSTGTPKEITLSRKQMVFSARLTGETFELKPKDKALVCLSVETIAGMMMLVRGFVLELELYIIEPIANPLKHFEEDINFAFTALVPLQLYEILKGNNKDITEQSNHLKYGTVATVPYNENYFKLNPKLTILEKMKAVIVGGAPLNLELEEKLQSLKVPFYSTYGMTETVTHIAIKKLNGKNKSAFFQPLRGVKIAKDPRGCLTIQAEVTNQEIIVTNDLVEINKDKTFEIIGRIDNVINTGGFKVSAEKIEKIIELALKKEELSRTFFVTSIADEKFGELIIAIFEGKEFEEKTKNNLANILEENLKKHEIPKHFYFIDKILRTKSDKVDKIATKKLIFE
jgi:O-succinylbenzoic acid--CoA ligase